MNIVLISLVEDLSAPSLRYLSAHLKAQGHATTLIFLPWNFTDPTLGQANSFRYPYPASVLEQLAEKCRDAHLIGLSLMTCHFDNAVHVTRFLRARTQAPIIWGGIHPTVRPAECLRHADMICIGEGEISTGLLANEMAGGKAWESLAIPGILTRHSTDRDTGAPGPIFEDLNRLPMPDYDLKNHYLLHSGNLVPMEGARLSQCLSHSYGAMFSRGCPYSCTYCCNNALRTLYQRKLPVRWRNVENRIAELEMAIRIMPDLRVVGFADDAFLAQPREMLASFFSQYKEKIHRPFMLLTTPRSVAEETIELLIDAGLYHIGIGIQSGSERVFKKIYARPETVQNVIAASRTIKRVSRKRGKQVLTRYDVILDNPWEADEDIAETIRLCGQLDKPFNLATFSLTLYPGTQLYERARAEGLIVDDVNQVYRASQLLPKRTYMNGVVAALSANVPNWIVAFMLWKPFRHARGFVSMPYAVAALFETWKLGWGFLGFLAKGEWTTAKFLFKPGLQKWRQALFSRKREETRPIFEGGPGEIRCQPT